jgi:hypothetical protein
MAGGIGAAWLAGTISVMLDPHHAHYSRTAILIDSELAESRFELDKRTVATKSFVPQDVTIFDWRGSF